MYLCGIDRSHIYFFADHLDKQPPTKKKRCVHLHMSILNLSSPFLEYFNLENIAVYSCYFIGQLQESILLRVHWISIYRVHALRAFSLIFCACANLIAIATRVIDRKVWTVCQLVSPCFACASAYVSKPVLV